MIILFSSYRSFYSLSFNTFLLLMLVLNQRFERKQRPLKRLCISELFWDEHQTTALWRWALLCAQKLGAKAISITTTESRNLPSMAVLLKLTVSESIFKTLPERCCKMQAHASPDVGVVHSVQFLTRLTTDKINETMGQVAASCSPVGGVGLQESSLGPAYFEGKGRITESSPSQKNIPSSGHPRRHRGSNISRPNSASF